MHNLRFSLQYLFKRCAHRISLESYIWKRTQNPRASLFPKRRNPGTGRMRRLPVRVPARIHARTPPTVSAAAPDIPEREVPDTGPPVRRDPRARGVPVRRVQAPIFLRHRGEDTNPATVPPGRTPRDSSLPDTGPALLRRPRRNPSPTRRTRAPMTMFRPPTSPARRR